VALEADAGVAEELNGPQKSEGLANNAMDNSASGQGAVTTAVEAGSASTDTALRPPPKRMSGWPVATDEHRKPIAGK
jgi:hypothetical protein